MVLSSKFYMFHTHKTLERRCLKLCKDELLPHFKQTIVETQLAVRDYFGGGGVMK